MRDRIIIDADEKDIEFAEGLLVRLGYTLRFQKEKHREGEMPDRI